MLTKTGSGPVGLGGRPPFERLANVPNRDWRERGLLRIPPPLDLSVLRTLESATESPRRRRELTGGW